MRNCRLRNCRCTHFTHGEFLIILIVELHHALHIANRKTFDVGILILQIISKTLQSFFAPPIFGFACKKHGSGVKAPCLL